MNHKYGLAPMLLHPPSPSFHLFLKFLRLYFYFMCLPECYVCAPYADRGQKASDPLGLEL